MSEEISFEVAGNGKWLHIYYEGQVHNLRLDPSRRLEQWNPEDDYDKTLEYASTRALLEGFESVFSFCGAVDTYPGEQYTEGVVIVHDDGRALVVQKWETHAFGVPAHFNEINIFLDITEWERRTTNYSRLSKHGPSEGLLSFLVSLPAPAR